MLRRAALPLAIFVVCALVYVLMLGERAFTPSPNNHYVHLAQSFLHGQLSVLGNKPPGNNDWALYNGTWFVSFPPFPAVVILPAAAIWGTATLDRLFWALLAGVAPALLFVLLRGLSERGESSRGTRDNLVLCGLLAFGSVFFYTAVQGTVWFAAHVVAVSLLILFLLASFYTTTRPLLAGLCVGLAFMCRPPTAFAAVLFVIETLRRRRRPNASAPSPEAGPLSQVWSFVAGTEWRPALRQILLLSAPLLALVAVQLWMNAARWDDPFVTGHEHLQIRWKGRIEKWGLFDYHYVSKNLAVFLASLPWFSPDPPYVKISLHGLALWVTTPNLLWVLWPKRCDARMVGLYVVAGLIALTDLCYQNTGWIQFGYRFALDYMPFLIALLALGGRRFGTGFYACLAFAVAVNTFGALTFDRSWQYYDNDRTQNRLFQPD